MPKFSVSVERSETYSVTFDIEADTEEAAYEVAEQLASNGKDQAGTALEWNFEDETFEVTSVDALDDEPEEPEEA